MQPQDVTQLVERDSVVFAPSAERNAKPAGPSDGRVAALAGEDRDPAMTTCRLVSRAAYWWQKINATSSYIDNYLMI